MSFMLLLHLLIFLRVVCCYWQDSYDQRSLRGKESHLKSAEELKEAQTTLLKKKAEWQNFSSQHHDPDRNRYVRTVLSQISGIYRDKDKVKKTRLENTVLLNVIEATDSDLQMDKYNNYLHNLLCFTKNYDYESVVYIIDSNRTRFQNTARELTHFDKNIKVLTYPYERFWQLIGAKSSVINEGFGKGDYSGSYPSFPHFGSLVMLVPILEALELGFNVIFFDVDIALVKDPLPYLIEGNADVIVSPELRVCTFPSFSPESYGWKSLEPNTGTMHVRSTPRGVRFFQDWLRRIIEGNVMNDQRDVNFDQEPNSIRVSDCVTHDNYLRNGSTEILDTNATKEAFKYCYLNEFMFQNGLMEFYCSKGKRGSSVSAYMLGMERFGVISNVQLAHGSTESESNSSSGSKSSSVKVYSPVTLHVNFCVTKRRGLDERGLWLYKSGGGGGGGGLSSMSPPAAATTCLYYDVRRSYFTKVNWTEKFSTAHTEFQEKMSQVNLTDGALVKFPHSGSVYLLRNGTIHLFPNKETFLKMGYDFDNVKMLRHQLYLLIRTGPPLHDLEAPAQVPLLSSLSTSSKTTSSAVSTVSVRSKSSTEENRFVLEGDIEASIALINKLHAAIVNPAFEWNAPKHTGRNFESVRDRALLLANVSADPIRRKRVSSVLRDVAGIYVDSARLKKVPKLKKTVLLTVLEAMVDTDAVDPNHQYRYRRLIKNHICYNQQQGFISLVYVIDTNATRFAREVFELKSLDPNIRLMEYPYELFWRIVAQKNNGRFSIDYAGTHPTFKHFGFLVMLVPILEALELGYDVAYFDVDTAILRDPFPYLTEGTANINVSPEMRTCIYPSIPDNKEKVKWLEMEPNTGAMLVRSSPQMIGFYKRWLYEMVQGAESTDQKLLMQLFGDFATQSYDCNPLAKEIFASTPEDRKQFNFTGKKSNDISFCFLNEVLFQNGKLGLTCAFDRQGSRSEYLVSLATTVLHYDTAGSNPGHYRQQLAASELYNILNMSQSENHLGLTPLTVHANYVDEKIDGLFELGLWLADNDQSEKKGVSNLDTSNLLLQCKSFVLKETYYGKLDWLKEMTTAKQQMESLRSMSNNTVFKQEHRPLIFLKIDNSMRPFHTGEIFLRMGYQWNQVKNIKQQFSFFMNFTVGPPIF